MYLFSDTIVFSVDTMFIIYCAEDGIKWRDVVASGNDSFVEKTALGLSKDSSIGIEYYRLPVARARSQAVMQLAAYNRRLFPYDMTAVSV